MRRVRAVDEAAGGRLTLRTCYSPPLDAAPTPNPVTRVFQNFILHHETEKDAKFSALLEMLTAEVTSWTAKVE